MKSKRTIALLVSIIILLTAAFVGTVAYLTSNSEKVVNTFTIGKVNISLQEHDWDPVTKTLDTEKVVTSNDDYFFVPGDTLEKDPWVTVKADSEKCYVFLRLTMDRSFLRTGPLVDYQAVYTYEVETADDPTEGWVPYDYYEERIRSFEDITMSPLSDDGLYIAELWTTRSTNLTYVLPLNSYCLAIDGTEYPEQQYPEESIMVYDDEGYVVVDHWQYYIGNPALLLEAYNYDKEYASKVDSGEDYCLFFDATRDPEDPWYLDFTAYLLIRGEPESDTHSVTVTERKRNIYDQYFYRIVDKDDEDQNFFILKDNQVLTNLWLESEAVDLINNTAGDGENKPRLMLAAAAVQYEHMDLERAFGTINWYSLGFNWYDLNPWVEYD